MFSFPKENFRYGFGRKNTGRFVREFAPKSEEVERVSWKCRVLLQGMQIESMQSQIRIEKIVDEIRRDELLEMINLHLAIKDTTFADGKYMIISDLVISFKRYINQNMLFGLSMLQFCPCHSLLLFQYSYCTTHTRKQFSAKYWSTFISWKSIYFSSFLVILQTCIYVDNTIIRMLNSLFARAECVLMIISNILSISGNFLMISYIALYSFRSLNYILF